MSDHHMASASAAAENHRGLRALALGAVIVGVLALAVAAFLLSYSGIHALALAAGVSPSMARLYPMIFDAMLVIACAAVLSLRGAGLAARFYAWLSLLVLLAAAAGADALDATGTKLPHRPTAAAAAIIPWALVLIGFGLLLTMLRHARQQMAAAQLAVARPASQGQDRIGIQDLLTREPAQSIAVRRPGPDPAMLPGPAAVASPALATRPGAVAGPAATASPAVATSAGPATGPGGLAGTAEGTGRPGHGTEQRADLVIDTDPGQDDPTSDEAHDAGQPGSSWVPRARDEMLADSNVAYTGGDHATWLSPAPTPDFAPGPDLRDAVGNVTAGQFTQAGQPNGDVANEPAAQAIHSWGDEPAAQSSQNGGDEPAAQSSQNGGGEPAAQPTHNRSHEPAAQQTDNGEYEPGGYPSDDQATDPLRMPADEAATAEPGLPADAAAEAQPADDGAAAQPSPAALPQFLRKWSPPTPPED
jgi:Protein of unknown function (DUF2637)